MESDKSVTKQVKSKQRVAEHGEVFTNELEVRSMCDLVSQECDGIKQKEFAAFFMRLLCG